MPGILTTPRGAMVAENIRNLQGRPCHGNDLARRLDIEILQGALHRAQEVRRDLAVTCGVLDLLVSEQYLDDADVLVVLQEVSSKCMAPMSLVT